MSSSLYFLAIDLGTTSAKVLIVQSDGIVINRARAEFDLQHPQPTWAEVDANDWWDTVKTLIHHILDESEIQAKEIAAIGLSGLMHALVPVDQNGNALDRPMLWMDQRCKPQRDWMITHFGKRLEAITGGHPSTTTSSPKLRWLVENRPEIVDRTHYFLLAKDFIRFKLTGKFATDVSDSRGTSLLDKETGGWSEVLLEEIIGVSARKMPPIRQSTEIAGYLTESAAEATGLLKDTSVVVGASDVTSTLIGGNAYVPNRIYLYMGTAAWMVRSLPHREGVNEMNRQWLGATATLGASMKWYKDVLGESEVGYASEAGVDAYQRLEQLAAECAPGSAGLIFLPHLMGERAPKHNPDAKGGYCGLTLAHRKPHLIRAIFEGNAYLIRHIIESNDGVDGEIPIFVMGGGAQSRLWCEILTNVCRRRILIPRELECGGLGAAMIAAVGIGRYSSFSEVGSAWVEVADEINPDENLMEIYEHGYQLYREIDAALEPIYIRTAAMQI
ncbi:hypothetical protein IH992_11620 [Candidatus Poribacteria bacterium]|nr:hypothetical protein [Candidatus Poribacteria bacterium]